MGLCRLLLRLPREGEPGKLSHSCVLGSLVLLLFSLYYNYDLEICIHKTVE